MTKEELIVLKFQKRIFKTTTKKRIRYFIEIPRKELEKHHFDLGLEYDIIISKPKEDDAK